MPSDEHPEIVDTAWTRHPPSAEVDPAYQDQVDRTMARAQVKWDAEVARLAKAERRRDRLAARVPKSAREKRITKRQLAVLNEEIEQQRRYMQSIYHMMISTGAPSVNRGDRSFRPVPQPGEII